MGVSTITANSAADTLRDVEIQSRCVDIAIDSANGYTFVSNNNLGRVELYRSAYPLASNLTTPDATFTASGCQEIAFHSNGASSYLFVCTASGVRFFTLDPATVTGTVTTSTVFPATNAVSVAFRPNGTTSYLFVGQSASNTLGWIFDPATYAGATATATFTNTGGTQTQFIENGSSSYLLVCGAASGPCLWRFNPATMSGTITRVGQFNFSNGFSAFLIANGASSAVLVSRNNEFAQTSSFSLWRGNIDAISGGGLVGMTVNFTTIALELGDFLSVAFISGIAYCFVGSISANLINVYQFNPLTITNTATPRFKITVPSLSRTRSFIRGSRIDLFLLKDTLSRAFYFDTDLNLRSPVLATTTPYSGKSLFKPSGGTLTLSASTSSEDLAINLRAGATSTASGLGSNVLGWSVTASNNVLLTLGESLTITGGARVTDSDARFVMGSGTVLKLGTAGNYSTEAFTVGSGRVLEIIGPTTIGPEFILQAGAIVRSVGGAISLTIPYADPGVVLEGGATLITPQIRVVAANFADGVRAQVSHRQIFTISSTAINTSTDVLTLGNDSNGDAANFRTSSPNTLVRFSLTSGATIPTSSPQIIDGGLYYWKSGGQLSIVEGGTAINFSTQGSGNFVLVAETEINNAAVSGGAGYSFTLTRSNNAQIRVKAAHWSELSGNASSSKFYDQVFAWSSTAGISILDTVNNAVAASQESIHEQIVAITSLPLEGPIKDATGATITSISPANSGAAVTGLALALEGVGKIQMNATDVDGILAWLDLYLWGCYVRATEAGIRLASATTFAASNIFNYVMTNLEFTNPTSTPLAIVGGVGTSSDGSSLVSSTTTGSIILNALSQGTGAIVSVSGSGSFNPATDPVIVGSIQANAITPSAIAANAITAAKIAPDALTEIRKDPRPTIETN
jgi:hypothetical protein